MVVASAAHDGVQDFRPSPNHVTTTAPPFCTCFEETLKVRVAGVTSTSTDLRIWSPDEVTQVTVNVVFFIRGFETTESFTLAAFIHGAVHPIKPVDVYEIVTVDPTETFFLSTDIETLGACTFATATRGTVAVELAATHTDSDADTRVLQIVVRSVFMEIAGRRTRIVMF